MNLGLLLVLVSAAAAQDFDLLILRGRIVDGTGNPAYDGDIGIRQGRIAAMGRLAGKTAARTIDAAGLTVAPGLHRHPQSLRLHHRAGRQCAKHGPPGRHLHDFRRRRIGRAQQRWKDFNGYFAQLLKQGISTNIGSYVGSSEIWTWVHGERAGPPSAEELERCAGSSRRRWSKVRSVWPVPSADRPDRGSIPTRWWRCARWPSRYGGIYSTHMRTEGQGVFESVAEAIDIGRRAHVPVDIIHLKIAEHKMWGQMPELMATIAQARAHGQDVQANVYPYRAGQNNLSASFRRGRRKAARRR